MKKLTTEEFIEKAKLKYGDRYDYSNTIYINSYTKVKIKCNRCGKEILITPHNHMSIRGGCKKCSSVEAQLRTKEEFVNKAKLIHGNKYNYDNVVYTSSREKVKIYCNNCCKFFIQTPKAHLQGENCPFCYSSFGEEEIKNYLDKYKIKYIQQKKFSNLFDKRELSYDFYLPEYNLLIEYNGEQHYKIIEHFGGRKRFLLQKHHDWLKRKYAKDNSIGLLIITYKDDSIEQILNERIN